jgi:hypothetical protein
MAPVLPRRLLLARPPRPRRPIKGSPSNVFNGNQTPKRGKTLVNPNSYNRYNKFVTASDTQYTFGPVHFLDWKNKKTKNKNNKKHVLQFIRLNMVLTRYQSHVSASGTFVPYRSDVNCSCTRHTEFVGKLVGSGKIRRYGIAPSSARCAQSKKEVHLFSSSLC